MEQPAIEFQTVTKRFRSVRGVETLAVADVDVRVATGRFVVLLGPSGCGKSTLLRLAAGLEQPTSGQIMLAGVPVTAPRPDVAFVFQRPVLLPWRNALANVLLPADVRRLVTRLDQDQAEALLHRVGLRDFRDAYPGELSGGMQARVALARALSQDPDILLMDEPFAALDSLTRADLASLFLELWEERHRTVLFVTHSIDEAILLADQIHVMSPGPGRIVHSIDVTSPRPRSRANLIDPEGLAIAAAIRETLATARG